MTPDEVRKQIKELDDEFERLRSPKSGLAPKGELEIMAFSAMSIAAFDLVGVQILEAIAEGRCTEPQICAREFMWHRKRYCERLTEEALEVPT